MSRERELAKNTIILTVGKICTQFVSFLLLPLYTALLLPEQYGVVDLLSTYTALLTPVFNWQFENGLFRFMIDFREDKYRQKSLFSTIITANIIQSLFFLVLYALVQKYISLEFKLFLAIDVVINIFLNSLLQLPRGLGNNLVYSIASFLSAASTVVLNVAFIAGFHWGAWGLFVATILAKVLTCIYLCISMKIWTLISIKTISKELFRDVLKYSLPLVPNQLSWWVVSVSDRTIIARFINVAANGIYSVANKFSTVFVTFYNIFNLSWTESVSLHMNDTDRDEFLTDIINTMFNLFAAVDFGIIACMPFVFNIMVNIQYSNAYYQIPILMIAVLFQVIVGLYSVIYVALKKSTEIAKTSFFAAIINITFDIVLIKSIGLYAASVSTLVAYAAMAIYRYFDVKKYVHVCFEKKYLLLHAIVGGITVGSYYLRDNVVSAVVLMLVALYAVCINKKFLKSTVLQIYNILTKILTNWGKRNDK